MGKKASILIFIICSWVTTNAQLMESFVHTGELGIGVGVGHYFGDLNQDVRINAPKLAFGIFYRKQVTNYIGVRVSGEYSFLGYSDIYNSNPVLRKRNLSFNTNIWEVSISGDFNFFRFQPGFEGYNFTPYIGLGVGVFSYDPYTYLNGQKFLLRPLGTEGQANPYGATAMSIPFTFGIKYALNTRTNFFAEVMYRFTNTDYLDDVSGLYADPSAFPPLPGGDLSPGFLLQDRSYETGNSIGFKGKQRGSSLKSDAFLTLKVGLSFNLQTYKCPTN